MGVLLKKRGKKRAPKSYRLKKSHKKGEANMACAYTSVSIGSYREEKPREKSTKKGGRCRPTKLRRTDWAK